MAAAELEAIFAALEREAAAAMAGEGVAGAQVAGRRSLDMRYRGQSYELAVPVPEEAVMAGHREAEGGRTGTHADSGGSVPCEHAAIYGHSSPGQPTEIVQVRLQAIGRTAESRRWPTRRRSRDGRRPRRSVAGGCGCGSGARCRFIGVRQLRPGHHLAGPALVLQEDTTTLVPPGWNERRGSQGQPAVEPARSTTGANTE